jgi:hypothetical protein
MVAVTCVAERNSHLNDSQLNFGKNACICATADPPYSASTTGTCGKRHCHRLKIGQKNSWKKNCKTKKKINPAYFLDYA